MAAFSAALLDPERSIPAGLRGRENTLPQRGFAVYRNNVTVSLVDALSSAFPVCERLVGSDFFRAMARVYVMAQPPRSPILLSYGETFPEFIADFPPARSLPYLPDVARLELARTRCYHAADAAPLAHEDFRRLDAAALDGWKIRLHPALAVLRSPWAIVTIHAANMAEGEPPPLDPTRSEDALVYRDCDMAVEILALTPGAAAWLSALAGGATLTAATEAALADSAAFDMADALYRLIHLGLAVAIEEGACA